jgi:hypothetical protein
MSNCRSAWFRRACDGGRIVISATAMDLYFDSQASIAAALLFAVGAAIWWGASRHPSH